MSLNIKPKYVRSIALFSTAIVLGLTAFHGDLNLGGSRQISSLNSEETDPTILPDFNARLTDVGPKENVDELYTILSNDVNKNAINNCFHRAHIWSYQMKKLRNVESGKIFLFYGSGKDQDGTYSGAWGLNGTRWWFHVAPYVVSEGKEYVMEKIMDVQTPMLLQDWVLKHSSGKECKVLDGTEKHIYDYIRSYNSIPMRIGGHPCYIRKTSMAYRFPTDIVEYDIDKKPLLTELDSNRVYGSCMATFSKFKIMARRKQCSKFLNDPVDPDAVIPSVITSQ